MAVPVDLLIKEEALLKAYTKVNATCAQTKIQLICKSYIKEVTYIRVTRDQILPNCMYESITRIRMDKAIYEGCNNVVSDRTRPQR